MAVTNSIRDYEFRADCRASGEFIAGFCVNPQMVISNHSCLNIHSLIYSLPARNFVQSERLEGGEFWGVRHNSTISIFNVGVDEFEGVDRALIIIRIEEVANN